jgi:hypothetical protein
VLVKRTITYTSRWQPYKKTDTMKIKKAFLFFLLVINSGFLFGQANIDTEYEVSLKALTAIRENNIGAFKALIDENILKTIKEETLTQYVSSASEIVSKYDKVAPKEFVLLGTSATNYQNKNINILSLIFPFPPPNKPEIVSDQQIIFIFSDDIQKGKIVGFRLRDFAGPARKIEEEAKKKPHLEKFNLKAEQVDWFRIWYDKGPVKNDLGNKSGVYALSGNKTMLKTAKIYKLYSEILNLVNTAKIDSTDINYSFTKTIGNPEYLYLRMTFNNSDYKDLGEFSILTILTEEKGVDELYKGYIIVKHSETHRYFLKISENMELWNKLNELAHIDHGNLLEKNP